MATVISSLHQTLSNLTALIAPQYFAKSRGWCKGVDSKGIMIEQVCTGDDHSLYEVFILCKRKQMGKVKKNGHLQILSVLNEYQLYPLQ